MDRFSCAAFVTLAAVVCAASGASGCSNVLGFHDFTTDDGQDISQTGSASRTSSPSGKGSSTNSGVANGSTGATAGNDTSSAGIANGTSNGTGESTSNVGGNAGGASAGGGNAGGASAGGGNAGNGGMGSSNGMTVGFGGMSTSTIGDAMTSTTTSSRTTSSSSSMGFSSSAPGPCTFGNASNGNGSFTYYWFGQGTSQQNGKYKTACGYFGTESGQTDTVPNAASGSPANNTYFAAIPGGSPSSFDTVTSCGACVEITGQNGSKIVATIIDECPTSSNPKCTSGHLDLSYAAFNRLGYSTGDPSGTNWKFVACPVSGNIQAVDNSANQVYLQNSVYPISKVNGQGPSNYGYFSVSPGWATVTSDVVSETITINIPAGGGDTGNNFTPPTGNCY